MDIIYRKAEPEDCGRIAELMDLASGGIIKFLYHDNSTGLDPAEFVAQNLQSVDDPYNYNSAIVADGDGIAVGVSYSYPSIFHGLSDESSSMLPPERIEHFKDFFNARIENSWFIDSFAVDPDCQRLGIGKKLIEKTSERAMKEGFSLLSLMVFADNKGAVKFYRNNGFEVAKKVKVDRHELIPHDGGFLLMKKILNYDKGTSNI